MLAQWAASTDRELVAEVEKATQATALVRVPQGPEHDVQSLVTYA